jgi:hypothetical protein
MSNLGRRPVEQRKEGLHLMSAERWAHNLPLTVMSLACTVIYLSCNRKRPKRVHTLGRNYSVTAY